VTASYDAVVVGTDGSARSFRAVRRAGLYAAALDVELVVAMAFHRPDESEVGPASERAESPQVSVVASGYRAAVDAAHDAASLARDAAPKVRLDTVAVEGEASEALIELAASRGDALLIVGNQGMTGSKRFLLGSVPNKISHHAASDVLITLTDTDDPVALPSSVVIGTDGSATATRALERGLALAGAVAAKVTVLTAGLGDRGKAVLDDAAERAEKAGVSIDTVLADGEAADELVSAGDAHDLVIVGNRGMTGAARFLLGSVPNKISHHVSTDLLIIRTT
jgi:nucleotide-binding universal stress UspA family protein